VGFQQSVGANLVSDGWQRQGVLVVA